MKLLIVLVLALLSSQAVFGAYCPHRPEQNCDVYWAQGSSGSSNEAFWGLYSCQARGYPALPGSPCYDTSMLKDLATADPGLPQVRATPDLVEPSSNQKHLDDRTYYWMQDEGSMAYWTELEREASINKPRTSNWGQVGHIAVLQTGSGQPFLINHGYLPFKRSLTPLDGTVSSYQEHVTEELAPEATWSVCETDDCSVTSQPRLFAEESEDENWGTARHALPSYFNWNPCGQSSSVHLWVEGENLLTFVGVGSRTTWSDSRVVLGQCVDAVCSDVRIIPLGFNRGLPAVEHQCLGGFSGVGARIVVGSDGNPSVMWRNKFDPTQIVYIHCLDSACSTHATPSFFYLDNENKPALWWDLTASERGIWLVTLNSAANTTDLPPVNTIENSTTTAYVQITSCDDASCETYGYQFPSQANIVIEGQSVDNEWQWSTNNNDVAWAASAFSLGLTGDGYPLWVGQVERGPQSPLSWVVCSCRDGECQTPECHFIADSNSILDPALVQCANLDSAEHPSYLRSSVRLRVLTGSSDGLPVITQQISSVCVEITPLPYIDNIDASQLSRLARTLEQYNIDYSPIDNRISSTTQRKVLLQSQKTTYIHCLDATCGEAAVSSAESPKVSSVSHESGYNQVDSTFLANDKIVTIYSPDATSNEQSFSWTQGCAYDFTLSGDSDISSYSSTTLQLQSSINVPLGVDTPYDWDADGNLLVAETSGTGCNVQVRAYNLRTGTYVYSIGFTIDLTTILPGADTSVVGISSDHASGIVTIMVTRYSGIIATNNQTDIEYYSYTLDQFLDTGTCQSLQDPRFPSYTFPNCYEARAGLASIQGGIGNVPYFLTGASCTFTATGGNTNIYIFAAKYDDFAWTTLYNPVPTYNGFREVAYDYRGRRFLVTTGTDSFWLAANTEIGQFATNIGENVPIPNSGRVKVRQNAFCSLDRVSSMAGANLNGLANGASGIPNFVVLRQYLGVTPTPRTGGIKSWTTNRWSSPTGEPCQEASVAVLAPADDVVFLCSGLTLGDDQVWGSSPIAGWTRFWEWQEVGWGLRWRWQGDVQLGTDFSYLSASGSPLNIQTANFNNFWYYIGGSENTFSLYQTRPGSPP